MFLTMFFFSPESFGQFFTKVENPTLQILGSEGQSKWNWFQSSSQYDLKNVVTVASLESAMTNDGRFAFNIPDDECGTVYFKTTTFQKQDDDNFIWYGEADPASNSCECGDGYFLLQKISGTFAGNISTGSSTTFKLHPLSGSASALGRIDDDIEIVCGFEGNDAPTSIASPPTNKNTVTAVAESSAPCPTDRVRIAFFFSDAVAGSNPSALAVESINQLNLTLGNSGIASTILRFEYAGVFNFTPFVETGTIGTDMTTFMTDATVLATLDAPFVQADIAVLFTDDVFGTSKGASSAIGGNFAIVVAGYATSDSHTTVHEVGHCMGANHQLCSLDPSGACIPAAIPPAPATTNHGHNFKSGGIFNNKKRATAMHTISAGGLSSAIKAKHRIFNYSNPAITFGGTSGPATGSATANNAAIIIAAAPAKVDVRPCPDTKLSASLAVSNVYPNPGSTVGLTSTVNGGTPPYSYNWFVHQSISLGSSYSQNWSTSYSVPYNCSNCYYNVTLKVTSADGQSATAFGWFQSTGLLPPNCGGINEFIGDEVGEISHHSSDFQISPNPADESIQM